MMRRTDSVGGRNYLGRISRGRNDLGRTGKGAKHDLTPKGVPPSGRPGRAFGIVMLKVLITYRFKFDIMT